MKTKKVIVYVDGYNFYYGLKHGGSTWKRLYWLDVVMFFERMMLRDQELVEVKVNVTMLYGWNITKPDSYNPCYLMM